jgi:hypothetical protein
MSRSKKIKKAKGRALARAPRHVNVPNVDDDSAIWGALQEGVHIAGYTFERACRALETLLEGNRWKLGGQFQTVDEFMDSISLDSFRPTIEARRRIANRIKELQPAVSNRRIAKAIGVSRQTVDRDTGPNGPPQVKNSRETKAAKSTTGPNGPPLSGANAAKIVERRMTDIAVVQERRAERERNLGNKIAAFPDAEFGVILADPEWHDETHSSGPACHATRPGTTRRAIPRRSKRGPSPTLPPTIACCFCGRRFSITTLPSM